MRDSTGTVRLTHVPNAPAVPLTAAPVVELSLACGVLAVAGAIQLRHRNLALPT